MATLGLLPIRSRQEPPPAAPMTPPTAGLPITNRRSKAQDFQHSPVAAPSTPPTAGLPIANRRQKEGEAPVSPPTAGLPIAPRQRLGAGIVPQSQNYIVDTLTTPVGRKGRRVRHGTWASVNSVASSVRSIPRWAQYSPCSNPGLASSSPVISRATSISSEHVSVVPVDSNFSFGFAPGAFARATHANLAEKYSIVHCVGQGQSGAVFIVQHKLSEKMYACKVLCKADHDPELLRREIHTLRKLDHPNIVRLFEVNEDTESVFLLMELCQGGDLFERIDEELQLNEAVARDLCQQMLSALAYCHARGVAHRDVKPENFLIENADEDLPTLKLADFGIATSIRPANVVACSSMSSGGAWPSCSGVDVPGSVPYMAPEVVKSMYGGNKGAVNDPRAADLWSCGVVLYAMLSGMQLFRDETHILSGKPIDFPGDVWKGVSNEAKDLISKLLIQNPEDRLTAQQALSHAWFQEETPCPSVAFNDSFSPLAVPTNKTREFAEGFLNRLKVWREKPKLQRVAIAAMARRLEEQHDAHRIAQSVQLFAGDSEQLTCERLVDWLNAALCEDVDTDSAILGQWTPFARGGSGSTPGASLLGMPATPSPASACASSVSPSFSSSRLQGAATRSGYHVRRRLKLFAKSLSGLSEEAETPMPTPASGLSRGASLVSITELRYLVSALDARKDGTVDYSFMLASLLQPEVFFAESRVREAFEVFDVQKRGFVAPKDVHLVLLGGERQSKGSEVSLRQLGEMVAVFDEDGDGQLNFEEFLAMVRGKQ